jgi:hypothetical protein
VICGAPPDQCDVHHLVHWIDGGETAVGNLALVCKPNHRDVHRGDWVIQIINGKVQVTRPGWAEPNQPEPGQGEPGNADWTWGGDAAERAWGGDPVHPDDPGRESGGSGEPARGESPAAASGEPQAAESRTGGRPQSRRGSAAGDRAWPWTDDPPPLTKEAADRLNAWGDDEPSVAPARREEVVATAGTSPWGDRPTVMSASGQEMTAPTEASPAGDSEEASPSP